MSQQVSTQTTNGEQQSARRVLSGAFGCIQRDPKSHVAKLAPLENSFYRHITKVVYDVPVEGICREFNVHGYSHNVPSPLGVGIKLAFDHKFGCASLALRRIALPLLAGRPTRWIP